MTKHSAYIKLSESRNELSKAYEDCPHWDYESDGESGHDCCERVESALKALTVAKRAVKRQADGRN